MNPDFPDNSPAATHSTLPETPRRWLVVLDHHEARIFHAEGRGATSVQIRPHQTDEAISHTDRFDGFSRGQEKPADATFFGPIADALTDADQILFFGGGTGTANEMNLCVAWLKDHRPELAGRIVGTLIVDAHHLTDNQLLALARDFHSTSGESSATGDARNVHPSSHGPKSGAASPASHAQETA